MNPPSSNLSQSNSESPNTDPIELEVFKHLFTSIAEEMGIRLMRSAYSPNIKERRDYSCAVFDTSGDMIAQAAHIPVHLGSCPLSVKAIINRFKHEGIHPTDRFIVNDPYEGGTHLPDITLVAGIFIDNQEQPSFYVCNRAHHADVGGITPGSLPLSTNISEEGVRIPPTRITDKLITDIANQTRTPDERLGDLKAQLASLDIGITRMTELCDKYQLATITRLGGELQNYTQRYITSIISDMPDGTYSFTDYMDDDGHGNTNLPITAKLTIAGQSASIDFSDSTPQSIGPINAVHAITQSAVMYCFRCLADEEIPSNSGVLKSIRITTKPGTIVDATYPAAVAAGNVETSQRIVDTVFGSLAQACPNKIPAASQGTMNNITIGSSPISSNDSANKQTFAYYETIAGGAGATQSSHGSDAIHTHMTNTLNTPIEALEHAYPFRIGKYLINDLPPDSLPPNAYRGGNGLMREYIFDTTAIVTLITERRVHPPYSLPIGSPPAGAIGHNTLIKKDEIPQPIPAKISLNLQPGDRVQIQTPSGGHWLA
ncbi:Acetophenone carboxylase delta subunit [Poriferisphaera corsica]|uniref:Acetophenone carboxylase delta subunit n=1 Tax=Poriferisphaera corsica TaxID=2528020 RepID=A0A517YVF0_9BACT|nr:hydantoinase B/oxoprolinase family protein [Poriferisphaera corsica]QDU34199.1 Acetophenone carboxylase delta subunit [Poriferisphaera corsica]